MATPQEQADAAYREYQRQLTSLQQLAGGGAGEKAIAQQTALVEATAAASRRANDALVATYGQDTGGGNDGGSTYDPDAWAKAQAEEAERRRRINAVESLRGLMSEYGLSSLMGKIEEYVKQGYNADAVMVMIRTTPEYKERFPAMEALAKKGRALSEAAYIEFERNAAQLERAYGLPAGMLDKDIVTNLLTNEVSARELEERVTMAATGAYQTPPEVRQQFSQYYGIGEGALTAYFLDPEKAIPLLNKQFASAQIGAAATAQDVNIGVGMAERLQEFGVTQEQAREGFGRVARGTSLSAGRGDVVSQEQLISGNLMGDVVSQQAIQRASAARVGRFQQGGGAVATQQGVTGAGTAATR